MSEIHVEIMALPAFEAMSATLRLLFCEIDDIVRAAKPEAAREISRWLNATPLRQTNYGKFQPIELEHPLSAYAATANSEVFEDGRSQLEQVTLERIRTRTTSSRSPLNEDEFVEHLSYIHTLVGCRGTIRECTVHNGVDRHGDRVVYPDANELIGALRRIYEHWALYHGKQPAFAATVAMVALMNLHPFPDGNGRVARVFFNWTLNFERKSVVYLPLYELSALSNCGYLIRLREAQYFGRWEPIVSYLSMVAKRLLVPASS